ncbi:TIR domain-containing protein [Rathayibacter sp. AY1B8]|uniref:TIR domain-containing protein n=1 Tax=Rathayibacter sp. AY1B8 TaxID=2080533 RepID=UPI000CE8D51F|nr:TIR domain-containing protein [Rathayibacter sp. AY1B8]PPI06345.1 hypothetical protein C5C63_10895 [Rathayibacter sp. AY1B8]
MKVFISWSKPQSRAVADLFRVWLPKVIQQCRDPFMSTETTKGEAWFGTITTELQAAKVGVVFITAENQNETWLNFESGAMLTKFETQRLLPVLVNIKKADYSGPLKNLQLTEFDDVEDMRKLMKTINGELPEPLSDLDLVDAFDLRWPTFKSGVEAELTALRATKSKAPTRERTVEDKVDEMLTLLRGMRRSEETVQSESDKVRKGREFIAERGAMLGKTRISDLNAATWDRIQEDARSNVTRSGGEKDSPDPLGWSVLNGKSAVGTITKIEVTGPDGTPSIVRVSWADARPDSLELVSGLDISPF